MKTKLIFGADIVPTKSNEKFFISENTEHLFGTDLINLLKSYDYRSFNLEVPLTDNNKPISKNGPNLIADPKTIKVISRLNPTLLTLGNNHILDYGEEGLISTINILKEHNISYIGAGKNLAEARKPYIWKHDNLSIGIYNCTEHEFSISSADTYGANPYDPLNCYDDVYKLKKECDTVVVIYHGGKEHYRYPSPNLQKVCRKFVDKGADVVLCQHSHCIGCKEEYGSGTIVYGQGNFLFDSLNNEYWNSALLISLTIDNNSKQTELDFFPITKQKECIRLAQNSEKEKILSEFIERSEYIKNPGFIENKYSEFADRYFKNYLSALTGRKLIFRIINKITKNAFYKGYYSKRSLLSILNYIECEAHRELLIKGIKNKIEQSKE